MVCRLALSTAGDFPAPQAEVGVLFALFAIGGFCEVNPTGVTMGCHTEWVSCEADIRLQLRVNSNSISRLGVSPRFLHWIAARINGYQALVHQHKAGGDEGFWLVVRIDYFTRVGCLTQECQALCSRDHYMSISKPLRFSRVRNELACSSPTISRLVGSHLRARSNRMEMFDR